MTWYFGGYIGIRRGIGRPLPAPLVGDVSAGQGDMGRKISARGGRYRGLHAALVHTKILRRDPLRKKTSPEQRAARNSSTSSIPHSRTSASDGAPARLSGQGRPLSSPDPRYPLNGPVATPQWTHIYTQVDRYIYIYFHIWGQISASPAPGVPPSMGPRVYHPAPRIEIPGIPKTAPDLGGHYEQKADRN